MAEFVHLQAGDQVSFHCSKHGEIELMRPRLPRSWVPTCPECKREANIAAEVAHRAADLAMRVHQARCVAFRDSNLFGRFRDATFDNYVVTTAEQRRVLESCKSFVVNVQEGCSGGLWLTGYPGTGKTHLGAAMVNAAINADRPMSATIFTSRELIRKLRESWGREQRQSSHSGPPDPLRYANEVGVMEWFSEVDLLVLDEVGLSVSSEFDRTQLFEIVDLRYRRRNPIALISNLPPQKLGEVIGDRLVDRLQEGAVIHACVWQSYRDGPLNRPTGESKGSRKDAG